MMMQGQEGEGRRGFPWAEAILSLLGFVALSFLFCYPVGWSRTLAMAGGEPALGYLPVLVRAFQPVSAELAGGWDATAYTGLPASHHPMGLYYPPTMLLYSYLSLEWAYSLSQVLHFGWAGLGAYWLARLWRSSVPAACL